jgi:hypothetical protein
MRPTKRRDAAPKIPEGEDKPREMESEKVEPEKKEDDMSEDDTGGSIERDRDDRDELN